MNMKSNLAHEPSKPQGELVPFKRKERQAMSDHFVKGFVMVSRLYLSEVKPFLSPAAKDIYDELNARITGFNKESDHVSYSQLQGGKLEGSKKTSPATVRKGIKELLDLGVISIVSENSRKGNEYKINEVSLAEHFKNKSTTSKIEVLQKLKCEDFNKCSASTSKIEDTIDNFINNSKESSSYAKPMFEVQQGTHFIHYFDNDLRSYTLENLCNVYDVQKNFFDQAKASHPDVTENQLSQIWSEFTGWSVICMEDWKKTKIPMQWMTTWLNSVAKNKSKPKTSYQPKPKSALQQTADQWAQERFAEQQKASSIIDVNQDQVLIGGEREYF